VGGEGVGVEEELCNEETDRERERKRHGTRVDI